MRNEQGQFETGLVPWNKGLSGIHLSPHSEWKKGRPAFNKKPKIKKVCAWCRKEFEVKPSLKRLKCCSVCCGQKLRFTNQSHPRTGSTHTSETRRKMRDKKIGNGGPTHWNWKASADHNHRKEMNTKQGRLWRWEVKRRDKHKCQVCGLSAPTVKVVAHHIKPWKDFPEFRFDVLNGITLCVACHKGVHSKHKPMTKCIDAKG